MEVKRFITPVQIPRIAICISKHVLRHLCQLQWHGLVVARRMNQWWKDSSRARKSPITFACSVSSSQRRQAVRLGWWKVWRCGNSDLLFTYCTTFQCSMHAYLCNPYTGKMQQLAWGISLCNKAAQCRSSKKCYAGSCVTHRNTQTFALFHMLFIDTQYSRVDPNQIKFVINSPTTSFGRIADSLPLNGTWKPHGYLIVEGYLKTRFDA